MISRDIEVESMILPRDEAEGRFGFRLYQGGAVPGEWLRIVRIDDLDTEACGGTHLNRTGEAKRIIITGTKKIQDGIVRLEYVAGTRAEEIFKEDMESLKRSLKLCGLESPSELEEVSGRLFEMWKALRKFNSKRKKIGDDPERLGDLVGRTRDKLDSDILRSLMVSYHLNGPPEKPDDILIDEKDPDVARPHSYLYEAAINFKVQKKQLVRTLIRFLGDIDKWFDELKSFSAKSDDDGSLENENVS